MVVFEGCIKETRLDLDYIPYSYAHSEPVTVELDRSQLPTTSILLELLYLKNVAIDDLLAHARSGEMPKIRLNIIRHSPQVLYHGNPVRMLLLIVLPHSMLVEFLDYNSIDLPSPTWYKDMVEDVLDAFVYHECIPTFEPASRIFKDAYWLLQGDKYERLTLPQGVVTSVIGDYNAPVGERNVDNGRSKRRKKTPTDDIALGKVLSNDPGVKDEALALDLQADEYDKEPQEVIAKTRRVGGEQAPNGMDVDSGVLV
jgi:hypothetical protein